MLMGGSFLYTALKEDLAYRITAAVSTSCLVRQAVGMLAHRLINITGAG